MMGFRENDEGILVPKNEWVEASLHFSNSVDQVDDFDYIEDLDNMQYLESEEV